jgi:hypothetical protein
VSSLANCRDVAGKGGAALSKTLCNNYLSMVSLPNLVAWALVRASLS